MKSTGAIVDAAIAEMPAEFTLSDLGDYIVRTKDAQIKRHTLIYQINRAVKKGITHLLEVNRGTRGAIYGKPRNNEARERLEDKWLNSTRGVREEGPMPPEVANQLFGKDPLLQPPTDIIGPTKTRPEPKPEPQPPKVNGNNHIPKATPLHMAEQIADKLMQISGVIMDLKRYSGFELEAATANATDHDRLKRLAITAADMLSHFEAVLDVAAQAHIV